MVTGLRVTGMDAQGRNGTPDCHQSHGPAALERVLFPWNARPSRSPTQKMLDPAVRTVNEASCEARLSNPIATDAKVIWIPN